MLVGAGALHMVFEDEANRTHEVLWDDQAVLKAPLITKGVAPTGDDEHEIQNEARSR